ncbi:MAG: DNA polymerase III subunit gamma/tau [Iphinoe sp. HA4291-MV1]|jgi:DNA polymerase-3 subunit gamma/tau|nr:DNA polymerase III subunit gamma/tau [Iphinoe sp. HA4291-MV1]
MSYEPLHHKYRPKSFAELVGQEAIATTLTNAIRAAKIAPAYLFTGSRGTGKTSSARILAKSLNCLKSDKPTLQPCGVCDVCQGITKGYSLDVIEIDAASNTGVDNIREIIERTQFAPVQCRYKVYVIDECHMLSTAAFNALLKTLEEPPKHVVFVLATTDPQRVLPTIISRCQRFDFRRIDLEAMVKHLSHIAYKENIDITIEAITLIAQIAQGGLRDAESLLDQLSLLSTEVTPERVWDLVGSVSERDLLFLLNAIASDDPEAVLDCTRKILDRGREPLIILQNLAAFYRDLLIAKTAPSRNDLVACTPQTWEALIDFAQEFDKTTILVGQEHLRTAEVQLKNSTQPRLWLEVTLLGLLPSANISVHQNGKCAVSATRISSPVEKGEQRLVINRETPSVPSPENNSGTIEFVSKTVEEVKIQETPAVSPSASSTIHANQMTPPATVASTTIEDKGNGGQGERSRGAEEQRSRGAEEPVLRTAAGLPPLLSGVPVVAPGVSRGDVGAASPTGEELTSSTTSISSFPSAPHLKSPSASSSPSSPSSPAATGEATGELANGDALTEMPLEQIWQLVIESLSQPSSKALFKEHGRLLSINDGVAVVGMPPKLIKLAQQVNKLAAVEAALVKVCQQKIKVNLVPNPNQSQAAPISREQKTLPSPQPVEPVSNQVPAPSGEIHKPSKTPTPKISNTANAVAMQTSDTTHRSDKPSSTQPQESTTHWEVDEVAAAAQRLALFFDGEIIPLIDDMERPSSTTNTSELEGEAEDDEF